MAIRSPSLTDEPATWTLRYGGPSGSSLRVPSHPWSPAELAAAD